MLSLVHLTWLFPETVADREDIKVKLHFLYLVELVALMAGLLISAVSHASETSAAFGIGPRTFLASTRFPTRIKLHIGKTTAKREFLKNLKVFNIRIYFAADKARFDDHSMVFQFMSLRSVRQNFLLGPRLHIDLLLSKVVLLWQNHIIKCMTWRQYTHSELC